MQRPSFPITSPPLPLPKNTSTMPAQNISTSVFILYDGLSKIANYDLSTVPLKKWWQTSLQKPSFLRRSNILHENWVSYHLEEECWSMELHGVLMSWFRGLQDVRDAYAPQSLMVFSTSSVVLYIATLTQLWTYYDSL